MNLIIEEGDLEQTSLTKNYEMEGKGSCQIISTVKQPLLGDNEDEEYDPSKYYAMLSGESEWDMELYIEHELYRSKESSTSSECARETAVEEKGNKDTSPIPPHPPDSYQEELMKSLDDIESLLQENIPQQIGGNMSNESRGNCTITGNFDHQKEINKTTPYISENECNSPMQGGSRNTMLFNQCTNVISDQLTNQKQRTNCNTEIQTKRYVWKLS